MDSRHRSRLQQQHGPAAEPAARGAGGLLSEIRSSIRRQPFSEHYSVIPGTELGRGKFAVVRKCVEKCSGHEFAAKFMRKRRKGRDCRNEILHEIAVLELATPSSRVINLHQVYEMASEMVLVLEYSPEPPSSTSAAAAEEPEEPGAPGVEELIVMATYTLGQCRQSSSSSLETEALDGAKKPVSKCFKFEEPFSKLQEIPGEFIY
ncbi:unnamed protein product, partial [Tetraodon nigroviridis]